LPNAGPNPGKTPVALLSTPNGGVDAEDTNVFPAEGADDVANIVARNGFGAPRPVACGRRPTPGPEPALGGGPRCKPVGCEFMIPIALSSLPMLNPGTAALIPRFVGNEELGEWVAGCAFGAGVVVPD